MQEEVRGTRGARDAVRERQGVQGARKMQEVREKQEMQKELCGGAREVGDEKR